jgi:hypothetical protein
MALQDLSRLPFMSLVFVEASFYVGRVLTRNPDVIKFDNSFAFIAFLGLGAF